MELMSRSTVAKSKIDLAALRHELLTPLNHLIGFSEMLLEESQPDGFNSVFQHLTRIREIAKALSRTVQSTLVPGPGKNAAKQVEELRYQLSGPLHTILQAVGAITSEFTDEFNVADVLKIGGAASELLAFTQGRALAKPGVVPAHRRGLNRRTATRTQPAVTGNILVVDDNETSRGLLGRHLTRQGHRVTMVGSGAEALAALVNSRFNVVILDVLMPKLDGFQVLEKIKADPATADIPVIVISALDEVPGVVRCIEIGAEDYLFKPFDPVLLAARIDSCLEKKRLHDIEKMRARDLEDACERLHFSEERLRLALNADHARIWDLDLITDKVTVAGELNRLFGQTAESIEQPLEHSIATVHADDRERVSRSMLKAIQDRSGFHEEFRVVHPDGATFWVESMATLHCDDEGRPVRMIGITRDITQRKHVEEALRKSNQDFQQFAAAASHDLQEPLRAVSSDLNTVIQRAETWSDAEARRLLSSSVDTLGRMSKLISHLLDYSQVSAKP
jgi:PAS domain S-box-containing protein